MKKMIRETAEEILQEYTNCHSEVDEDCLVKMLEKLASDVAREIFAEIEGVMNGVYSSVQYECYSYGRAKNCDSPDAVRQVGKLAGVKQLGKAISELKKKYTEGEG